MTSTVMRGVNPRFLNGTSVVTVTGGVNALKDATDATYADFAGFYAAVDLEPGTMPSGERATNATTINVRMSGTAGDYIYVYFGDQVNPNVDYSGYAFVQKSITGVEDISVPINWASPPTAAQFNSWVQPSFAVANFLVSTRRVFEIGITLVSDPYTPPAGVPNDTAETAIDLPPSGFSLNFNDVVDENDYGSDVFYHFTPDQDVTFALYVLATDDPDRYWELDGAIFEGHIDTATYLDYDTIDDSFGFDLGDKAGVLAYLLEAGQPYTIAFIRYDVDSDPPPGAYTVHWVALPATTPDPVGAGTGRASQLVLADQQFTPGTNGSISTVRYLEVAKFDPTAFYAIGYDDSAWSVNGDLNFAAGAWPHPGTFWDPANDLQVRAVITATPGESITFTGGVDDSADIWWNGVQIVDDWLAGSFTIPGGDVLASNLLAYQARDSYPFGDASGNGVLMEFDTVAAYYVWALAVVTRNGSDVAISDWVLTDQEAVPGSGDFIQGHPHVARLTDTKALMANSYYNGNFSDPGRVETWARIIDISSGTPVIGPGQQLWDVAEGSGYTYVPTTAHPVTGNADYALIPARNDADSAPWHSRVQSYRIESDLSLTLVDTYVINDYAYMWMYQLEDGTFAMIWTGIGTDVNAQILTLGSDGTISVGSIVTVRRAYETDSGDPDYTGPFGFWVGYTGQLVPGTRKVLTSADISPPGGVDYDNGGIRLTDIDTGESGSITTFFGGDFVPNGLGVIWAGRTDSGYAIIVGGDRQFTDGDTQRLYLLPFTISGNDITLTGGERVFFDTTFDFVDQVEGDPDFGVIYNYDGGLGVYWQEYPVFPYARLSAQAMTATAGAGSVDLYLYDDDDPDRHWVYHLESMLFNASGIPLRLFQRDDGLGSTKTPRIQGRGTPQGSQSDQLGIRLTQRNGLGYR